MLTKRYIKTLCLFFVINCYGCNKSKNERGNNGTILSQTIITEHFNIHGYQNGISTRYYNYNQGNKLVSVISSSVSLKDSFLFEYDSQGQLTKMKYSNSSAGPIASYNFVYDTQGRIIKKTGTPLLANLATNDLSYTYDVNNNIIADSQHSFQSPKVANYNLYEYNNDGNISKQHVFYLAPVSDSVYAYKYDDKINPYYQIRSAEYFGEDNINALSKSNYIDQDTNPNHFIAITYSYYSSGLPNRIVYKQVSSGNYYTMDFIYK